MPGPSSHPRDGKFASVTDGNDLAEILATLGRIESWAATDAPPPVTVAEVTEAAAVHGWLPETPLLPAAVPARVAER